MARRRGRRRGGGPFVTTAWILGGLGAVGAVLILGAHLLEEGGVEPARSLDRGPAAGQPAEPPSTWDRVRVEVLNAGGVRGMAALGRDELRTHGFDVVYYGNARTFGREESVVLSRTGSMEAARAVAERLGIVRVEAEPDTTLFVDVSVLLGTDWTGGSADSVDSTAEAERAGEEGTRRWPRWDPRRYFRDLPDPGGPDPRSLPDGPSAAEPGRGPD